MQAVACFLAVKLNATRVHDRSLGGKSCQLATNFHSQRTFVAVGKALMEIRDRKLYREDYGTFEAFIQSEYGLTGRWGQLQMGSAFIAEKIGTVVPISIPNVETAREFSTFVDYDKKTNEYTIDEMAFTVAKRAAEIVGPKNVINSAAVT